MNYIKEYKNKRNLLDEASTDIFAIINTYSDVDINTCIKLTEAVRKINDFREFQIEYLEYLVERNDNEQPTL